MMLNILKKTSLLACSALVLQGCNSTDINSDDEFFAKTPVQMLYANSSAYGQILAASDDARDLFAAVNKVVTQTGGSGELCDVKITRMSFDTVGGKGEATTSTGLYMLPLETETEDGETICSGPKPVLLYAHGTSDDSSYDLSQFTVDPTNPAAQEATLLLAAYASQGYAVVAPNYAGYSDSSLSYHPYLDEAQQSTEMIDALQHARDYAEVLGGELSSDLFVSGMSQGGYVAMATHKALEAKGETVTASLPMSGPYATLDFMDTVFAGHVNGGATIFAPMLLTALDRAHDIYDDPSEVYASQYADFADNALPRPGGFAESGLPENQLFSGEPPAGAQNTAAFGEDHLIADALRGAYVADLVANPTEPANQVRSLIADADLRDWSPSAPLLMCGADTDPVVYHATNSDGMATYWSDLVAAGLVINLDLTDEAVAGYPFADMQLEWQAEAPEFELEEIHSQTSIYCSLAGIAYFNSLKGS